MCVSEANCSRTNDIYPMLLAKLTKLIVSSYCMEIQNMEPGIPSKPIGPRLAISSPKPETRIGIHRDNERDMEATT